MIREFLPSFEQAGNITSGEHAAAILAENSGTAAHTIGYEMEVLSSAAPDVPNIGPDYKDKDRKTVLERCRLDLATFGYGVDDDGVYELQSPVATHPQSLATTTLGVVRRGWLPNESTGLVTAHVSIGTAESRRMLNLREQAFIDILRAVELLRGSTPERLLSPVTKAQRVYSDRADYSWNCKGTLGVMLAPDAANYDPNWQGGNHRVEFRTLGYYSTSQFSKILDGVYYLTRGLLAPLMSPPSIIATDYHNWLQDYFDAHKLPAATKTVREDDRENTAGLESYLRPYADHMATREHQILKVRTRASVLALQEEFAMAESDLADTTPVRSA